MKLVPEWKRVVKKAWSIRLGVIAAIFSGVEVILPLFADSFPRHIFAVLSFFAVVGAVVARVVLQKELSGDR